MYVDTKICCSTMAVAKSAHQHQSCTQAVSIPVHPSNTQHVPLKAYMGCRTQWTRRTFCRTQHPVNMCRLVCFANCAILLVIQALIGWKPLHNTHMMLQEAAVDLLCSMADLPFYRPAIRHSAFAAVAAGMITAGCFEVCRLIWL